MTRAIKFPDKMDDALKALAEKKGLTVAGIVKLACSEFIENEAERELKKKSSK